MESVCGEAFQDNRKFFFFLFNVILPPPYPPPLSLPLSEGGKAPLSLRVFLVFLKDLFEHAASEQRFPGRIKVQEQKAS